MITANEKIITNINSPVRSVRAKVELYNGSTLAGTYKDTDKLKSFTIERVGEDSKFFGFGICQKANIKIIDVKRELSFTPGNHFRVYLGFQNEFVNPYPDFYITETHRDEKTNELSITAYDIIYPGAKKTVGELNIKAPYTIKQFANAIATTLGATGCLTTGDSFNLKYSSGANFEGTESIREALDDIAEATQTIYYIDNNQKLVFKILKKDAPNDMSITRDKYFTLKTSDNKRLTKIVSATELGDNVEAHTTETGTTQYVRDNAFWELREDIADILQTAITNVGSLTINQFECFWRGNFLVEPGDKLAITTKDGKNVISYLINDTVKFDGALSESSKWSFTNDNETEANPSTLGEALNKTFARVDKVNKQIDLVVSETKQNTDDIAQIKMDTGNIQLEVKSSVKSVKVLYALGDSRTEAPTTGWSETAPENDGSKYMWQKTITLLNDDTVKETKTCISGANGANGKDGKPGKDGQNGAPGQPGKDGEPGEDGYTPIKGVDYFDGKDGKDGAPGKPGEDGKPGEKGEAGASFKQANKTIIDTASHIEALGAIGTSHTTSIPNGKDFIKGDMVGIPATITDRNNSDGMILGVITSISGSNVTYTGAGTILSGEKGLTGKTGKGVKSIIPQYYLSTKKDSLSGGSWSDSQQDWIPEHFYWERDKITWDDNTVSYSDAVYNSALTEAIDESYKANSKIVLMNDTISKLQVNNENITARVENVEKSTKTALDGVNESLNTVIKSVDSKMSAEDVQLEIKTQMSNGIDKVETSTGFTFNQDGLKVSKSGNNLSTEITENGMRVKRGNDVVLTANDSGVDAKNLHATTYLIVGNNIRFEDYGNDRTACFYIG